MHVRHLLSSQKPFLTAASGFFVDCQVDLQRFWLSGGVTVLCVLYISLYSTLPFWEWFCIFAMGGVDYCSSLLHFILSLAGLFLPCNDPELHASAVQPSHPPLFCVSPVLL